MAKSNKFVTPTLRLSYTHLFEPRKITDDGEPKYSVSILIPKSDTKTVKLINDLVQKTIDENQETLKSKKGLKHPLRDGDEDRENDATYAGHYFISANASVKSKPLVIDKDRNEVIEARDIYSGMYGRVSLNFYAFNTAGNKGIAAGLNAVQKIKDGEPLGGTYTKDQAMEDFDAVEEEDNDLL